MELRELTADLKRVIRGEISYITDKRHVDTCKTQVRNFATVSWMFHDKNAFTQEVLLSTTLASTSTKDNL